MFKHLKTFKNPKYNTTPKSLFPMYSVLSPSSLLPLSPPLHRPAFHLHLRPSYAFHHHFPNSHFLSTNSLQFPSISIYSLRSRVAPIIAATAPSNEGTVSVVDFEDLMEKDWSFLETENSSSNEEFNQKTNRIISSGEIGENSSVLVSIGSEGFVDRVVESSPGCQLLVVHESLFTLACIKEKYDKVNCWQGELIYVPEKWAPFDVVFLYLLPALPFQIGQVLGALAQRCSPGARIVISHPQGREELEQQRQKYPDVIVSNLPDKVTIENAATDHSFEVVDFVDESGFYLSVLKFRG